MLPIWTLDKSDGGVAVWVRVEGELLGSLSKPVVFPNPRIIPWRAPRTVKSLVSHYRSSLVPLPNAHYVTSCRYLVVQSPKLYTSGEPHIYAAQIRA